MALPLPDDSRRPAAVLQLAADTAAVAQARSFVQAQCAAAGLNADSAQTAVLLTSEVVTNAVLHGRSGPRVAISASLDRVLVEVGDDNSRMPKVVEQDDDALDGRGLNIVDMLAVSWGAREDGRGKVVWFAL
jgi:anti-sigma regulatory factor (Ser/Thr protein kinase)